MENSFRWTDQQRPNARPPERKQQNAKCESNMVCVVYKYVYAVLTRFVCICVKSAIFTQCKSLGTYLMLWCIAFVLNYFQEISIKRAPSANMEFSMMMISKTFCRLISGKWVTIPSAQFWQYLRERQQGSVDSNQQRAVYVFLASTYNARTSTEHVWCKLHDDENKAVMPWSNSACVLTIFSTLFWICSFYK